VELVFKEGRMTKIYDIEVRKIYRIELSDEQDAFTMQSTQIEAEGKLTNVETEVIECDTDDGDHG
jgi:hypothetical protein